MICFNCGYKFPSSDVNECNLCGMKTPLKCFACGSPNPQMAKFCLNCGVQIAKRSTESSIENYEILSENRKNVAVVFADISGFTSLAEKMDPEEVRDIINECFNYITKPIYELGGTIDKYIGDCVMVLFGAKHSHSDDAKRAVTCALKMLSLIKEFSKEKLLTKELSLNLSIGISYGLVVTGSVGNYFDKDYTVMGDVVNTAQRLQSVAKEATILVSEPVYDETKDLFNYTEIDKILLKNKEKPVRCFQPKDAKSEINTGNIFLFERHFEIDSMLSVYDKAKEIECVVLSGESGTGKTILLKEFISRLPESNKKIWVDCSSIYQNRTNYVLSNLLQSIMSINLEDNNNAKKYRLLSFIYYILTGHSDEEIHKNANFLSIIMGLDRNNDFQTILNSMNYEDIERELVNQLSVFFKNLLKKHNYIFIIDSIQWADSSSLNFLNKLFNELSEVKSIFIFASRYEENPLILKAATSYHFFRLNGLSSDGITAMTCKLLDCKSLNNSFFDIINRITGGNPLYIKEFLAAVKRKEHYYIKEDTAYIDETKTTLLPSTIENTILANLAELDSKSFNFLQVASVIGSEFNSSWVTSLINENVDTESALATCIQNNIISTKSVNTLTGTIEKICIFNQNTTREVIYNIILKTKRQDIHREIGELIEQRYLKDLENYYEVLCEHFKEAGQREKTVEYYYRTALKHKAAFNYETSLAYFIKYIDNINLDAEHGTTSKEISAFINIGHMYIVLSDFDKALEFLNKALETTASSDDIYTIRLMQSEIYKEKALYDEALNIILLIEPKIKPDSRIYGELLQKKCTILRLQGNAKALQTAKKSEQVLLKNKDYNNLSETMRQAAYIYFARGDITNSLYYLNKAYGYAEKIDNIGSMARTSRSLGIIYHSSGEVSKALEYFNRSIEISDKISDMQSLISSKINLGILFMEKGLFDKAEFLFQEVLDAAFKVSLTYQSCLVMLNMGDLMYERGSYENAYQKYNKSLEIAKAHGLPCEEAINYIALVKLDLKNSDYENVSDTLEKAYKILIELNEVSYISDYYKYKSILEIKRNNYTEALNYSEKAVASAVEAENGLKRLRAIRLKGIILMLTGEFEKSLDFYTESISIAVQLESDYEVAKGYYRKSEALWHLNNQTDAEAQLLEAKRVIGKVDKCKWTDIIEEAKVVFKAN